MQNLCQTQLLRVAMRHLLAGDFEYCISPSRDNKNLRPLSVRIIDKPGPLTSALAKFLQDMNSGKKKQSIHPGYLFTEICKKAPRFKGYRQQDSQELLRYLLDSVRTEEIKEVKRAILHAFGVKNSTKEEGVSADQVDEDTHEKIRAYGRNARAPVIDSLFGGQLVSSLECCTCHKVLTIMESFFDLSLSLAVIDNTATKQEKTVPATKRQQTATPVSSKKNTKNIEKKNTKKIDNKDSELKPKPPQVLSKYQQKKKAKEAKKEKKRKRRNSGSNRKRKQSEVPEDGEMEDENNEALDDDVIENRKSNVNESSEDDIDGTEENDVKHLVNNGVIKAESDVTETLEQSDINVRENVFMNLVKGSDGIKRMSNFQSDAEIETRSSEDLTSNVSNDETSEANISQSDAKIATQTREKLTCNENINQGENTNIHDESFGALNDGASGKNIDQSQPEMAVTSGNRTEQSTGRIEDDKASFPLESLADMSFDSVRGSGRNVDESISECNGFGNKNSTEYVAKGEDFSGSSNLNFNGFCNNDDLKLPNLNKISSEDYMRESMSACNENGSCSNALNDVDSKNKISQHSNEENLNFINKDERDSHTSVWPQKQNNYYFNDDTSVKNNHTTSSPDNKGKCTELHNCERLSSTSNDLNDISNNEPTVFNPNSPEDFQQEPDSNNSTKRDKILEYANKIVNDTLKDSLNNISTNLPSEEPETVTRISVNYALRHQLHSKSIGSPSDEGKTNTPVRASGDVMFEASPSSEGKTTKKNGRSPTQTPTPNLSIEENDYEKKVKAYINKIVNDALHFILHGESSSSSSENAEMNSLLFANSDAGNSYLPQKENDNSSEEHISKTKTIEKNSYSLGKENEGSSNEDNSKPKSIEFSSQSSQNENDSFFSEDISNTKTVDKNSFSSRKENDSSSNENNSKPKLVEYNSQSSQIENDSFFNEDISNTKTIEGHSYSSPKQEEIPSKSEDITNEGTSECRILDNELSIGANNMELALESAETDHVISHAGLSEYGSEILSGNHSLGSMENIKSNMMSVESCLKKFCSPEILDGDNKFICEKCNSHEQDEKVVEEKDQNEIENSDDEDHSSQAKPKRKPFLTEAVKQLLINQAPPILTLHLKRFHQVGFSLKKLTKHVEFPSVLNLAPFCHKSSKIATDSEGKVLYALCGIVEHSGSLHSGHYTAYCRVPTVPSSHFEKKFENLTQMLELMERMWIQGGTRGSYVHEKPSTSSRWFRISDSHVSEVGLERALKAQAYLLFYERMVLSHGGTD